MSRMLSLLAYVFAFSQFSVHIAWAEEEIKNVYQVELVVFERLEQASNSDPETWPKNIQLSYPEHWQYLIDPEEEARRKAEQTEQQSLQDRWQVSDDLLQTLTASATEVAEATANDATPSQAGIEGSDGVASGNAQAPQWFYFLAKSQQSLTPESRALSRAPELRVLFHETWLQPFKSQQDAPALVLKGGNKFGEHYELEGSIKLFLSRYLHIQTNLWLTQFVPNHGQQSDHWPQLPMQPNEFEDLYRKLTSDLNVGAELSGAENNGLQLTNSNNTNNDYIAATATRNSNFSLAQADTFAEPAPAPYLINQIITMRQARRMRSNELHYLDHPRMGILIKITQPKPTTSS